MAPASVGVNQPDEEAAHDQREQHSISMMPDRPFSFSLTQVVFGPMGARLGLRQTMNRTVIMNNTASRMPGRMPAMNSLPMDCSVMTP